MYDTHIITAKGGLIVKNTDPFNNELDKQRLSVLREKFTRTFDVNVSTKDSNTHIIKCVPTPLMAQTLRKYLESLLAKYPEVRQELQNIYIQSMIQIAQTDKDHLTFKISHSSKAMNVLYTAYYQTYDDLYKQTGQQVFKDLADVYRGYVTKPIK